MDKNQILSKENIKAIYYEIYASRQYREMIDKFQKHNLNGNLVQATLMARKMKEYEIKVFEGIAKKYISINNVTDDIISSMNENDRKILNVLSNGLYLISDVINSIVIDVNTILNKYSNGKACNFDKLQELLMETKGLIKHFDTNLDHEKASILFGSMSDNLYKMIYNKANSYINKLESLDARNRRNFLG